MRGMLMRGMIGMLRGGELRSQVRRAKVLVYGNNEHHLIKYLWVVK